MRVFVERERIAIPQRHKWTSNLDAYDRTMC